LVEVIDINPAAARTLAETCGSGFSDSIDSVDGIDAAIIASSTDSHFESAQAFLEAGIPTFVEKPIATSIDLVQRLIDISASTGTPLMCGFVERFNPVVATSKQLINDDIFHIRTQRQSPPPGRYSSNAVWDLLIHDLDLVLGYFGPGACASLSAVGFKDKSTSSLESAEATFELHGAIASTMCSRLWQRKVRNIQIATASTVLELDLVRQTLTIYRNIAQEQFIGGAMIYRSATTMDVPFVRHAGEPLALQLQHFIELIRGTVDPVQERTSILAPHALAEAIVALCE
jgi:predicted dehydrogenase